MKPTTLAMEGARAPTEDAPRVWTATILQAEYYDAVFAFFARRIRPREEAEDLASATFLAAFQNLHRIRKSDPKLFLYGIARRKLADALRRRKGCAELTESHPSPDDDGAARSELSRVLRGALWALPSDQAEALMLQHLEDLSVREVAAVMNRSEKSVKALLQRAKERLRSNSLLKSIAEEIHV